MRQAQLLLGRIGFDPASVLNMSEAEIMSHIGNLTPKSKVAGTQKTYVSEAWRRRKLNQTKDA